MLTKANIEARDNAIAAGNDPPVWMTLNEYGDFSIDEYEAAIQQSGQINGDAGESTVTEVRYYYDCSFFLANLHDAKMQSMLVT